MTMIGDVKGSGIKFFDFCNEGNQFQDSIFKANRLIGTRIRLARANAIYATYKSRRNANN